MSETVNTDDLTIEQIRELAVGQPLALLPPQPRNPDGTFAPVAEPVVVEPVADATGTTSASVEEDRDPNEVFRDGEWQYAITIPGEDGAGDETFYGSGPDFNTKYQAAVEKLRQSKIHLNRKLRQQSQQIKEVETKKATLTADEIYLQQQEQLADPAAFARKMAKEALDSDPRIKAAELLLQEKQTLQVTTAWVNANPEYYPIEANGKRLWKEMAYNGVTGVPTQADIDKAYQVLKTEGLLQAKPTEQVPVAAPVRRSSGLSTRSTATPAPPAPPAAIDPEKMPLDELRILINRQAQGLA